MVSPPVSSPPIRDVHAAAGAGASPSRGDALWALGAFVVVSVVTGLVVWAGARHVTDLYQQSGTEHFTGSWLLGGWYRFDGHWYVLIARDGYSYAGPQVQSPVAFFPVYPLLLRFLHAVTTLPLPLLGTLVTFTCGAGFVVLYQGWVRDRLGRATARTAVLVLLLYPYAWYLSGAVYADALFLVATMAAFVLVEHEHPVAAGVAGLVATATRPLGAAVAVGLVAVLLQRRGSLRLDRRRPRIELGALRARDTGVLLSVGGLLGWMAYLWASFGAPLAFAQVQRAPGWDQGEGPRTWFKVGFLQRVSHLWEWFTGWVGHPSAPDPWRNLVFTLGLVVQVALLVGFCALTVVVWRRFGWGYGLYVVAALAIPLIGTGDFQGTGRYLLTAFPCFAALAVVLEGRRVARWGWLAVSGALLVAWCFAYGRGYYVS